LTKDRIAILSPLAAADGLVQPWSPSNTWFLWSTRISSHPKRHLDRFSRFCRAQERDQHRHTKTQTRKQTDHATPSTAMVRILCNACDVA